MSWKIFVIYSFIGIDVTLIESGAFGSDTVPNKVMNGGHYIKGKDGMWLIAESIMILLYQTFTDDQDLNNPAHPLYQNNVYIMQYLDEALEKLDADDTEGFQYTWNHILMLQKDVVELFKQWKENSSCNANIEFWILFLDVIFPVLRDLTHSIRTGNWELFLNSVHSAMPLFFAFGRVNYSRWTPLFLEDCKELQRKFPELHKHFRMGGWVMNFGKRLGSSIGFDMGLEKIYNKPAKIVGGLIGMTARKDAVAVWNLTKHEKDLHVVNLEEDLGLIEDADSELDLHHEFSMKCAAKNNSRVSMVLQYLLMIGNPFKGDYRLKNVSSGVDIAENVTKSILNCIQVGESAYNEYLETRMISKTSALHDTISSNANVVFPKPIDDTPDSQGKVISSRTDMADSQRYLELATERRYDFTKLLKFEITNNSYYLTSETKMGIKLKKHDKAALSREIVSVVDEPNRNVSYYDVNVSMVVVDFMALVRKTPTKKLGLKTYGDLAKELCERIFNLVPNWSEIRLDVIFDVYHTCSIKDAERDSRQQGTSSVTVTISNDIQRLPVNMELFWASNDNKMRLQKYFLDWMTVHYQVSCYTCMHTTD